ACGIAGVMTSVSTSFASNAFNVVKASCLSQHSLAHEIGHNQGNKHDRDSTTGSGAYAYSYGFRRCASDGSGFRTVMSYSCTGAGRVAWFSNPNAYYNGYSTGIAYESDPNNSADNGRSMNNTASTVAAFRSSGSSTTQPVAPTAPSAPSGASATATAYNSVTARWNDNSDNETGFKLERSGNGVDFTEIATLGAGTTSYVDNGVIASSNFYYRARAYNSVGNSGYSNTASVTTPAVPAPTPPPPATPSSVAARNDADGSATVMWADASTNEAGFEVRRETWNSRKSTWTGLTTVGTAPANVTSMVDMSGNGTYRYSVRATNAGGASALAGPAAVTVTGGSNSKGKGRR
ncbi:MAG: M12 family metallo-peptidase, partial [Woeseiaceae bacterium]|nr:M12 family metallo-peptidase [Woeseiaceae bacterium]